MNAMRSGMPSRIDERLRGHWDFCSMAMKQRVGNTIRHMGPGTVRPTTFLAEIGDPGAEVVRIGTSLYRPICALDAGTRDVSVCLQEQAGDQEGRVAQCRRRIA